jgi:hypothetical protein
MWEGQCWQEGGGGSHYKIHVPWSPEGGPGPNYVAYGFIFLDGIIVCPLYKLTLSDQAQVTLQLRVSLSDLLLVWRLLAGPSLLGSPKKIFSLGPESLLAGLGRGQIWNLGLEKGCK